VTAASLTSSSIVSAKREASTAPITTVSIVFFAANITGSAAKAPEPPALVLDKREQEAAALERQAIALAEAETPSLLNSAFSTLLEEAIALLARAAAIAPEYPSPWNNRAQILRLLNRDEEARDCLSKALALCEAARPSGRFDHIVKAKAHAQLAWLAYKNEPAGRGDVAWRHFQEAARLGCPVSGQMAVRCNPYAAMCNQMLKDAMKATTFYSR
jgi:tetratricopeptide (TPR) repeat protein